MQKSCNLLCLNANKPDATISSQSKCIFCKVIMNCGFANDKDLQIPNSNGAIISDLPQKTIKTDLDVVNSNNKCGHELRVDENDPNKIFVANPEDHDFHNCKKEYLKQLNQKQIINVAKNKVLADNFKKQSDNDSDSEDDIAPNAKI